MSISNFLNSHTKILIKSVKDFYYKSIKLIAAFPSKYLPTFQRALRLMLAFLLKLVSLIKPKQRNNDISLEYETDPAPDEATFLENKKLRREAGPMGFLLDLSKLFAPLLAAIFLGYSALSVSNQYAEDNATRRRNEIYQLRSEVFKTYEGGEQPRLDTLLTKILQLKDNVDKLDSEESARYVNEIILTTFAMLADVRPDEVWRLNAGLAIMHSWPHEYISLAHNNILSVTKIVSSMQNLMVRQLREYELSFSKLTEEEQALLRFNRPPETNSFFYVAQFESFPSARVICTPDSILSNHSAFGDAYSTFHNIICASKLTTGSTLDIRHPKIRPDFEYCANGQTSGCSNKLGPTCCESVNSIDKSCCFDEETSRLIVEATVLRRKVFAELQISNPKLIKYLFAESVVHKIHTNILLNMYWAITKPKVTSEFKANFKSKDLYCVLTDRLIGIRQNVEMLLSKSYSSFMDGKLPAFVSSGCMSILDPKLEK